MNALEGGAASGVAGPGNVVFDLDGVVYLPGAGIPGAGAALSEVAARGYRVVFATNNSSRHPRDVADRIHEATGYHALPEQVITSAHAAASLAGPDDAPAFVLGESGLAAMLEEHGIAVTGDPQLARSVFVGLDRGFTYDRLRRAATAALGGARLIATNDDATLPTTEGPRPGAGSMVAALERVSGRRAVVAGKPHEPMRAAVVARLGPGPTWMVGDRPETDIAFGTGAGWTTVLVLTGITPPGAPADPAPDHVVPSIADLPALLP
jgi:HAD superfamily hydrolase (TIGR01450 family)